MPFRLTSPAFSPNKSIPSKFSCEGENVNPELKWSDSPKETVSFVLIMHDPDVPKNLRPDGLFIHWLAWNIPADVTTIAENSEPAGVIGLNTRGGIGYTGPCPPDREHRYFFRIYALDCELNIPQTSSKDDLLAAINNHIIEQAELMGRFEKRNK